MKKKFQNVHLVQQVTSAHGVREKISSQHQSALAGGKSFT
jgi:hypothetical protein